METEHRKRNPLNRLKLLCGSLLLIPCLFIPDPSSAQDFTATTIGNYGDITMMEVTGNYDADTPGGSTNAVPRQEIAKEFFKTHPDEYDCLVIFTNFDFQMPEQEVVGFYLGIRNTVRGIGKEIFDRSSLFGSNGRLQGTIDMGNIRTLVSDPLDPGFEQTMTTLSHEFLHRWAARVKFEREDGTISTGLLGKAGSHWSFLLDTSGSVLYGNRWQDNGDGTFTALPGWKYYSPLDLYLMGLNDRSEVPPMLLIENPEIDPQRLPEPGVTITGTAHYISIDDIIAAEGERIPGPEASQKTFKTAFILATRPGTFAGDALPALRDIIEGWVMWFSSLTDGKAMVQVDAAPLEEIPTNPGARPPPHVPRTTLPEIDDGVAWLLSDQETDGSWMGTSQTVERDTAEVVQALSDFPVAGQSLSAGLQWLGKTFPASTDYISRKIEALVRSGKDTTELSAELVSRQNPDGGWGSSRYYVSNPADTSCALRALAAAGYPDDGVIGAGIEYLKARQNPGGGWGHEDAGSSIQATVNALFAFTRFRQAFPLDDQIQGGIGWLLGRQNADGGFGNSSSTVYDTATAVLILREFNISPAVIGNALTYILDLQSEDGSWFGSPYETALAVRATWKATIDPDLSVSTSDISFSPPTVTGLPADVVVTATVWNTGTTDVPEATVALYDGAVTEANRVGEQTLGFPGKESVTATFNVTITDGNAHRYRVAVDPEGLVRESNESNNTALKVLFPETTYDFEILPSGISLSPDVIDIFGTVSITSRISNHGTSDAYDVPLKYTLDGPAGPLDIALVNVDIPAGETIRNKTLWRADQPGENLAITVSVDPTGAFTELSEENNTASASVTVNPSTRPNLTVSHKEIEITPLPAREGGSVTLSALIKNEGFSPVSDVGVRFTRGVAGEDGVVLGTRTIPLLSAGDTAGVSVEWTGIGGSGQRIITVEVDPEDLVEEISEDDNSAFVAVEILSLPDLAISRSSITFRPPVPRDGDPLSIQVTVQNAGDQEASHVFVAAHEGGRVIGSRDIPVIHGNSQAALSFTYDTAGRSGPHEVTILVDPEDAIPEQNENNNSASRSFGVQDADLWVTEQYISPNGDGIKDSTQFFFRLETPQTVQVAVVGEKGEKVRTFRDGDFEETVGGTITWDGLDDSGRVVGDGQYQIQVLDGKDGSIAGLPVTVDNNRSPLTRAIGTDYLVHYNLTCMLRGITRWKWFPDESGIVFRIAPYNASPEYPHGLYTMAPDGGDVAGLLPREWIADNDPAHYYRYETWSLSPDGERVAFTIRKYRGSATGADLYQLWIADRNGANLLLLQSYDFSDEPVEIGEIHWSPDSSYIAYETENLDTHVEELWTTRPDGTGKMRIDSEYEHLRHAAWSPDSRKLAAVFWRYDYDLGQFSRIVVADTLGNERNIYEINGSVPYIDWISNQRLIIVEHPHNTWKDNIRLLDASGNGDHIRVPGDLDLGGSSVEDLGALALNPVENTFAFIDTSGEAWSVKVCDDKGNWYVVHESARQYYWAGNIGDLRWSRDGTRLAFVDRTFKKVDRCHYEGHLVVIDPAAMEKKAFKVSDGEDVCETPQSYHIWTLQEGSWVDRGVLHYDFHYKTEEFDLTEWLGHIDGPYRVRITQKGMDAAHVDYIALSVNGRRYTPAEAVDVSRGEDIRPKVGTQDNDVADVHESTVDLTWQNLPPGKRVSLVMNAREEDLASRKASPFRFPQAGYYPVELDSGPPVRVDGEITLEDGLPEPLFREYTRPVTGHPEGYTYGYIRSDGTYLYGVLDFTPDNTLDRGNDWAAMEVVTPRATTRYLISDSQRDYGTSKLTYTERVNYEHMVYEFRVPLEEIGARPGDTIDVAFTVYGTAGGSTGDTGLEYSAGSLKWLGDETSLLGGDNHGVFVIDSEEGDREYLPIEPESSMAVTVSPLGRYITYDQSVDPESVCQGFRDLWALASLLNLTASLRVSRDRSAVVLEGIAADLNFAGYTLEYADAETPDKWNLIAPPSDVAVINDVFTSWVPPHEGTFLVRLRVFDRAGNVAQDRRRVTWGLFSSITNIYKTDTVFSPNGDGVKDTAELHYRVLEPVHLEFYVLDGADNLIRTFLRDYAAPAEDRITWDGRDENGRIVPDGEYRIRVFDYEFFFHVDNTPPDVDLELSSIDLEVSANLLGLAVDPNMKTWVVEYGQGENPQEWYKYRDGIGALGQVDQEGRRLRKTISSFHEDTLEFAVGKKFRMTAEDHAGNRATAVSGFLRETVVLYKWEKPDGGWYSIELGKVVPAEYVRPGLHLLRGFESLRLPTASMNIQYRLGGQWMDAQALVDPSSGVVDLEWDNSGLELEQVDAVRIRAVDAVGAVYFSNAVFIRSFFDILTDCSSLSYFVRIHLFEELTLLEFQVQSQEDQRYYQWTDYRVYDAGEGDPPPMGDFTLPLPPDLREATGYRFRMIGLDANDDVHESKTVRYPVDCSPVKLELKVGYDEPAGCGSPSSGEALISITYKPKTSIGGRATLKTLRYYIQKSGDLELLGQFDLATEGLGTITLDTTTMPEGIYPLKAVLEYASDNRTEKTEAAGDLVVDRVLPEAEITFPDSSTRLCPAVIAGPGGDWYGIDVEGLATDNNQVARYELSYGMGENPERWLPALTRVGCSGMSCPIAGSGPVQGRIGTWDVTDLRGTSFSLRLRVVDAVGNVSCYTTSLHMDRGVFITSWSDRRLFSPSHDSLEVHYSIDEYATVDVEVVKDEALVRTLAAGEPHPGGTAGFLWDGRDDSGAIVPDGAYKIRVSAIDSCGNFAQEGITVSVDGTPPTVIITTPQPEDTLGIIVEARGTAYDRNFASYVFEAREDADPDHFIRIESASVPQQDEMLGRWNTYGLEGSWTLRLTATDTARNTSETTVRVELGERAELVKSLDVAPGLFSPNDDGKLDTAEIRFELTEICDVTMEIRDSEGGLRKAETLLSLPPGAHTYSWDGTDAGETTVPDGTYTVMLGAALSSSPDVTQTETITVVVDSTSPVVDMEEPLDRSYIKESLAIRGTITDQNLAEYAITYTGDAGGEPAAGGSQNREDYTFATIHDLPEGEYTLTIEARDLGENANQKTIRFTVDRTPPKLTLEEPEEGGVYGAEKGTVHVRGTIDEENLETYALRYGPGENPEAWTALTTGDSVPGQEELSVWTVGKDSGIPDGLYTLSLYARDRAGWEGEKRAGITIDNTAPEVEVTWPQDGGYVREPSSIEGTVFDRNLQGYAVEISEGPCAGAFKWAALRTSADTVEDGVLAAWEVLPPDGTYCLRVRATDRVGNTAGTNLTLRLDTRPPGPPLLSGEIENRSDARLTWSGNTEADLAGYNVYRGSRKVNPDPITNTDYLDQSLGEGNYAYTVKAVDYAGWESEPSNEITLRIDATPPEAGIRSPRQDARVSDVVNIKGTAYSPDDFKEYRVSIGRGPAPAAWNLIRTSPVPTIYGTLACWDTLGLDEGRYSVRLEAEDLAGNISTQQIVLAVDNTPPAAPVLLSAASDLSDVELTWQANSEADLAGYLLYRNRGLANVSGTVIGDLGPYLIAATTYKDTALPDGTFSYYLVAMDTAGNTSGPSATLVVEIDTHPPKALIVAPQEGQRFASTLMISADSVDLDIATVRLQYKRAVESSWTDLGGPLTKEPYITYLDPVSLGLIYGDYHLRAVATDKGGMTDPSPGMILVSYTDLEPPGTPGNLKALVDGEKVALTWTANREADLDGYNVYRVSGEGKIKVNTEIVKQALYECHGLADGDHTYEITALDTYGNESEPSSPVTATVYAPQLIQPYTPTGEPAVSIRGKGAAPGSNIETFVDTGAGFESQGTVSADGEGNFSFDVTLSPGESRITARAKDAAGNTSRSSDAVIIAYNEPPSTPTGLAASVDGDDDGYQVTLTWNPNPESDLSGYNLYRDGEKLNTPLAVTSGIARASSTDYYSYSSCKPEKAFDSNAYTYWKSRYNHGEFDPQWWQIDLASSELINRIEIAWGHYPGMDYEIQVWSVYGFWIPLAKVTGNEAAESTFDFAPSYRTNRIRIYVASPSPLSYAKQVTIAEVRIFKDNLISRPSYQEIGLGDAEYRYRVTAVDDYGFESPRSEELPVPVGDVIPPEPPQNLTATAYGPGIVLAWSVNSEPDLAGYNVYRKTDRGWTRINGALLAQATYTDGNLTNGAYTYTATAVDHAGNESLPSGEASAGVNTPVPQKPENIAATAAPQGGSLTICWEHTGGGVAGYNLYRSLTPGGPYTRVNQDLITGTCYLDTELTNGTTYHYVVVAVDGLGNESVYSDEVGSVPADIAAPLVPELFFPTTAAVPLDLKRDTVKIAGRAEPASTVELFRDGVSLGKTIALERDLVESFSLGGGVDAVSLSPDGTMLAYSDDDGSIWLKNLATGSTTELIQEGNEPLWAPDGRRLAYLFEGDKSWNDRLAVYDLETGESTPLTDNTGANEYSPSWSSDGNMIAFISGVAGEDDVWVKNLATGSLTRITEGAYPDTVKLSPEGERLAYVRYRSLYVVDLVRGETTEIDSETYRSALDWSLDGKRLAFVSERTGHRDVSVLEVATGAVTGITDSESREFSLCWSPDGRRVVYAVRTAASDEIWLTPADAQGGGRLLYQVDRYDLDYLAWARSGGIACLAGERLTVIHPQGHFGFTDLPLERGENRFRATATDSAGNTSLPSEEITLFLLLPDLATLADGILIYPPYPILGEEAAIGVFVWNGGPVEAEDVDVDIYLLDPTGNIERVESETIAHMAPLSGEWVGFTLDTTGKPGENSLIVLLDPEDRIYEASEANNSAIQDFYVAYQEKVEMTTALDSDRYTSNQEVYISVDLYNSGMERDAVLEVRIEDEGETTVALVDTINTVLPYASEANYRLAWNTAATYAGSFRVHTILSNGGEVIAENTTPFTIMPDIDIDSVLKTDRVHYGPHEDVRVSVKIENRGENHVFPVLDVRMRIMGLAGDVLFRREQEITNLFPGTSALLGATWNGGLNPPGDYRAVVEVYLGGEAVSTSRASFSIRSAVIITGTVTATPAVVFLGDGVEAGYTLTNRGNAYASGLTVKGIVLDRETQTTLMTAEKTVSLAAGETRSGQFLFSSEPCSLKTYHVLLQCVREGETKKLASTSFIVKDGTAPEVTIVSPVSGGTYDGRFYLVVMATDDASGIDLVEYRIDGGPWRPMPASNPSSGRYATTWDPVEQDEGTHTIGFRARDREGNLSQPVSVPITIELTPPFERLSGTISAQPDPVYRGLEEAFLYSITNDTRVSFVDLIARVLIVDPDTGEVKNTLKGTVTVPANGTAAGTLTASTLDLAPRPYKVILEIASAEAPAPRALDTTTFEVVPSLEVAMTVADPTNLLVWVNEGYHRQWLDHQGDGQGGWSWGREGELRGDREWQEQDLCYDREEVERGYQGDREENRPNPAWAEPDCRPGEFVRVDLLERILDEAGTDYLIVYDRKEFEEELRNPYHTDILILGNGQPLGYHSGAELREKVHSGTGLVSSLWLRRHGWKDPLLGVRFRGKIWRKNPVVHTAESPITREGSFDAGGMANRVEPLDGTTVAGWIEGKRGQTYPAIVLNRYGLGKTIYYGFDLGQSLNDDNYEQLAELIENSICHVHRPVEGTTFSPYQVVPLGLEIRSLGGSFDVEITEAFPQELVLYDPTTGDWTADSPWTAGMHLEPYQTGSLCYYVLTPDLAGTYTMETAVGLMEGEAYRFFESLSTEILVGENSAGATADIITELRSLTTPWHDRLKLEIAIWSLERIQERVVRTERDVVRNIRDVLRAIDSLLFVRTVDVTGIRSMLDALLRVEQGMYYYFSPPGGELVGTLSATPDQVCAGEGVTLHYTLTNEGGGDLYCLTLRVVIIDPETGETIQAVEKEVDLPADTALGGDLVASTENLWPGTYDGILQVVSAQTMEPRVLAGVTFEVAGSAHPHPAVGGSESNVESTN